MSHKLCPLEDDRGRTGMENGEVKNCERVRTIILRLIIDILVMTLWLYK